MHEIDVSFLCVGFCFSYLAVVSSFVPSMIVDDSEFSNYECRLAAGAMFTEILF